MANLSRKNPIKNIGAKPPTITHETEDGDTVEEKVNPNPNHRKMVDLDGNVVRVSLSTGYTVKFNDIDNHYGRMILAEKRKKGFILYSVCPVKDGAKECKGDFSDETGCCKHVEDIIRKRRERAQKRERATAAKYKNVQERHIEALMEENRRLSKPENSGGGGAFGQ